jgi:glycosyltransferase involved in cell wall biosynthesis
VIETASPADPSGPAAAGRRLRLLTLVVPFFNEAANVSRFVERVGAVLAGIEAEAEIVCINDGSSDDTLARLLAARARDSRIRVLDLSRNFGKEFAVTAGLGHARGDAVVLLDADLQHPPEAIPDMLAQWAAGYEIVHMVRSGNERPRGLDRQLRRLFYLTFRLLAEVRLPTDASDYLLLDRRVVEVVRQMPERSRFMKGIYNWIGFRQVGIPYREAKRTEGSSRWSLLRLLRLAADGITAFSNAPLKIWGLVGALVAGFTFVYAVIRVLRAMIYGIDVPGYESIFVAILFLGGMQLLTLGIMGSYIGRIFDEVKGRPLYIVRRAYGFEEAMPAGAAPEDATPAPAPEPPRRIQSIR